VATSGAGYRGRHEVVRRGSRLPAIRPGAPGPRPAPSRTARHLPAAAVLAASGALAYAGARRAGPPSTPPPDDIESALIADAAALARSGLSEYSAPDGAAALQLAAWSAVRGLWGTVSALTAARELLVLAAIATVLLTGGLARRLGLSLPGTAVATVATATLPWALAAHRLVAPVNLAVPWLLAGVLCATAATRHRCAAAPAVLCLLVAALTAPLVVPVAVASVAVLLADRDLGAGWPRSARAAGVAVLGVLAAGLFAIVAGLGGDRFGLRQVAPDPASTVVDVVAAGALVIGAVAGTVVRWLRPFALVVLGCLLVAAVTNPVRTPLLLLTLPLGAVLLAAAIDAATSAGGVHRHVRPTPLRTASVVTAVVLAGGALVLLGPVHR